MFEDEGECVVCERASVRVSASESRTSQSRTPCAASVSGGDVSVCVRECVRESVCV